MYVCIRLKRIKLTNAPYKPFSFSCTPSIRITHDFLLYLLDTYIGFPTSLNQDCDKQTKTLISSVIQNSHKCSYLSFNPHLYTQIQMLALSFNAVITRNTARNNLL